MDIRTEILPDYEVLFVEETGPYQEKAGLAWQRLWDWVAQRNLQSRIRIPIGYGLDNPKLIPADMLRYYACVGLEGEFEADEANGIGKRLLSGGRFAIHCMTGPYSQMPERFEQMHDHVLGQEEMVPDYSRPFYEIYLNDPQIVGLENTRTDLCIPIRETN